jgi:hypothetical protein
LPPEGDRGGDEASGKDPPRRTHLHVDVEMGEQDPPRVDAACEQVEHCFAGRGHRGGADGKKQEMKRSYLAVASVERPVGQQPDQEPRLSTGW